MLSKNATNSSYQEKVRTLLNNKSLSDVCLLVGQERTKIYANRSILSVGSDVFWQLLYGEWNESPFEIELTGSSLAGLTNVLR